MQFNNGNMPDRKESLRQDFSLRDIVNRYVKYLPWILFAALCCLAIAYTKLRYSINIYEVTGELLIKKQSNGYQSDKFENLFFAEGEENLKDEIEQIKSTSIARRVIEKDNLQTEYFNKGKIKSTLLHRGDVPFSLEVLSLKDSNNIISFPITLKDEKTFYIEGQTKEIYFGQPFKIYDSYFRLNKTQIPNTGFASNLFEIKWHPIAYCTKKLISDLNVSVVTEYSNILSLKYETENVKIGKEIINGVMAAYQDANLEDKRQIAVNALSFINEQLDTLRIELGGVERNLQQYREKNKVIDIEQQSSYYFQSMGSVQTQITDLEVKNRVIQALILYLQQDQNKYKTVPVSLGIPEPSLVQLITEYNRVQLQREIVLRGSTALNPVIADLETAIEKLRADILENLKNIRDGYSISLNRLNSKSGQSSSEISTIPGKQKQLIEITRQQKILEELYSLLLQKKLETSISSASTIYSSRVIEPADSTSIPIKPNTRMFYVLAILIGIALPVLGIGLKELFNDKVISKLDIEKNTDVPVLGEIGHADIESALVVAQNSRSYISEQFRILRSNLQFFIQRNENSVILVTSSFSGEGKSFISTNLGAVLALSGKKTLILEFDIRKPKILKGLGIVESKGITNFIVGNEDINDLIRPIPNIENLFVMPCGPIPPNPSELLMEDRVKELFEYAKQHFDIIIVDTAPVGIISDALTLGQYVTSSIFIVRHNYTFRAQIKYIEELYVQQKLPKLSIVINDVSADSKGYGQGYYSYGYGYGYGYGSDYFEQSEKKKKRRIKPRNP